MTQLQKDLEKISADCKRITSFKRPYTDLATKEVIRQLLFAEDNTDPPMRDSRRYVYNRLWRPLGFPITQWRNEMMYNRNIPLSDEIKEYMRWVISVGMITDRPAKDWKIEESS